MAGWAREAHDDVNEANGEVKAHDSRPIVVCKVWEGDGPPRPPTYQMDGKIKTTKTNKNKKMASEHMVLNFHERPEN